LAICYGLFPKVLEIVKEDIMEVFNEFHRLGKFEKSFNATLVTFIPKKAGAVEMVREFNGDKASGPLLSLFLESVGRY
jgi:hypothetical protein